MHAGRARRPGVGDDSGRAATIEDVAEAAGVSRQTVSRVLNNSVAVRDATRERVLDCIRALGYSPDPSAQALGKRRAVSDGETRPADLPARTGDGVVDDADRTEIVHEGQR